MTRPELELKSFVRVGLAAGQAKRITFRVPVAQLGFYARDLAYVVEPGVIEVFVGRSSVDLTAAGSVTVAPGVSAPGKAFDGTVSVS